MVAEREKRDDEIVRIAARRQLVWERSCQGWTQSRIAEDLGVSQNTVCLDLKHVRDNLPPLDVEGIRQSQAEFIRQAIERLFELVQKDGAPVTAGQQGEIVRDPETDEPVRDYALRVAAFKEARMYWDRLSKLSGADASMKIEHSGEVVIAGPVDVELEQLARELGLNAPEASEVQQ